MKNQLIKILIPGVEYDLSKHFKTVEDSFVELEIKINGTEVLKTSCAIISLEESRNHEVIELTFQKLLTVDAQEEVKNENIIN